MEPWIVGLYYFCFFLLLVYAAHRLHLVRLRRRLPANYRRLAGSALQEWPHVAVQLPLYNEPSVAARLIDAAARLQYPGRLEIQVLDDSSDQTTGLVAERVAAASQRGVEIRHIRRGSREGYKAGALAEGMRQTGAELFAIFDADFLPQPDLLLKMVPPFADAHVGMVQARWEHLNRNESILTRLQGLYLDAHFAVESAARFLDGRFFNFNGTGGVWRRKAIEEAGGWSASTLTEDLDLSYRAQLSGWRFVFLADIDVEGELPASISGFLSQQHRWTKGSIQTSRKLLKSVLLSEAPLKVKTEAFFHLTGNLAYVLTLLLALLVVPALEIRYHTPSAALPVLDFVLFVSSALSLVAFCREGQRQLGGVARWRDLALLLPLGVGLSLANAQAVLEGFSDGGEFRRTAKRGSGAPATERPGRIPIAEALMLILFATAAFSFALSGRLLPLLFLIVFITGYGYLVTRYSLEWVNFLRRG